MKFFNIDEGLRLPQSFDIMHNALEELYAKRQETFQKDNPLTKIYKTVNLDRFQKSYGSSTGFKQAFEGTVDYASAPGFTDGDGFRFTIGYKAFSGKISFTWQLLLEADPKSIGEKVAAYQLAWHRQVVQYGIFALTAFFGGKIYDKVSKTYLLLTSADTPDGDTMNTTKNPIFSKSHTVVRREGMSDAEFNALKQSNKFYIPIALDGSDKLAYAKLANGLYQIRSIMANYLDDNGQLAGSDNRKTLVMTDDAHLKLAIKNVLTANDFTATVGKPSLNPAKDEFDLYTTPYLNGNLDQQIPQFAATNGLAKGILMLDPTYNSQNMGPMMVERFPFKLDVFKTKDPDGLHYAGKQAFDFFCPSWRGIAYIYIGTPDGSGGAWNDPATFTQITPVVHTDAIAVVGTVQTVDGSAHDITVTAAANATVVPEKSTAYAGEVVALTITPTANYHLTALAVNSVALPTNATSFIMPNGDAVITYTVAAD